jgi:DNA-binding HxlR family transcriptional regulator
MSEDTLTMTGRLDPRGEWEARGCTIAKAMDVVGSRSAFLLLREAFYGTTRFDDFAKRVGISEPVAAARLKELVEVGLLERRPYQEPGQRTRMEYRLTEMGTDFFPALAALMEWGDRWLGPAGVEMRHHACGGKVRAELRCDQGHRIAVGDIDLVARRRNPS